MSGDSGKSIGKEIIVAVVAAMATVFVTKTCDRISPEDNRVIISDTLRVIEAHSPQKEDSLLYTAISELNSTIREAVKSNNSISIVLPESKVPARGEKQEVRIKNVMPDTSLSDNSSTKTKDQVDKQEYEYFTNQIIDKDGFYKKGYMISDGGVFYVLEKKPKVSDPFLNFEIRLFQPAELLSHIYLQ